MDIHHNKYNKDEYNNPLNVTKRIIIKSSINIIIKKIRFKIKVLKDENAIFEKSHKFLKVTKKKKKKHL